MAAGVVCGFGRVGCRVAGGEFVREASWVGVGAGEVESHCQRWLRMVPMGGKGWWFLLLIAQSCLRVLVMWVLL